MTVPAARGFVGATALSAGLTLLGCSTDPEPNDSVATTTMMGSASAGTDSETGPGTTDPTTTDATETTDDSVTDTDDSITDTDDSMGGSEAAYGVPAIPCDVLDPVPLTVGANAITIDQNFGEAGQNCGGVGTASVFMFTAEAAGDYEISLDEADFNGVISLYGDFCDFFSELSCVLPPEVLMASLDEGEVVHIAVDANDEPTDGAATLTVTPL